MYLTTWQRWACAIVGAVLIITGIAWSLLSRDDDSLNVEVYQVCAQYANLDLSGMVKMCKMVGFQQ